MITIILCIIAVLSVPTEIETNCKYWIDACKAEDSTTDSSTPCSQVVASLIPCDDSQYNRANYWTCVGTQFASVRDNLSKTTQFMEACFYEESKDLGVYSYYQDRIPSSGIAGLSDTQFQFSEEQIYAGDSASIMIQLRWPDTLHVVPPPDIVVTCPPNATTPAPDEDPGTWMPCSPSITTIPWDVTHVNLHACFLSPTSDQSTCSIKFPSDTSVSAFDSGTANVQGGIGLGNKNMNVSASLTLPEVGTYKLLGHIRYLVETDGTQNLWDIGVTKQIVVLSSTSGAPTLLTLATAIIMVLGFL